ncbi:hypothetical protein P691DRAFT_686280 [Macrolepiota fuliginosa MF-IS2]|uniref:Uncharacterized protein n=1 Tax=Macrolepiota fuliginosa MF-IS2 TaxID=1400762 RepID=A0A9P5WYI7_9AGAR|nr:hypothetical protein P691DRAFT_686280 [Macrolepiota fuliginosa MF-IS2]
MQRSVVLWITGVFQTSLKGGTESIMGLILIKYHIHKLAKHCSAHFCTLPFNHPLKLLTRDKDDVITQPQKYASPAFNMMRESINITDHFHLLFPWANPGSRIINKYYNQIVFNDISDLMDDDIVCQYLSDASHVMIHQKGTTRMALWLVNTRRITS